MVKKATVSPYGNVAIECPASKISFKGLAKKGRKLEKFMSGKSKKKVKKVVRITIGTNTKLHFEMTSIPLRAAEAQIKASMIKMTSIGVSG